MAGRKHKEKGNRRERKVVKMLRDIPKVDAKRIPLSGSIEGYRGDIALTVHGHDYLAEVKARKNGEGWKQIREWLFGNDFLFLVADHVMPLVVMPWVVFRGLVSGEEVKTDGVQETCVYTRADVDESETLV